MHKKPVVCCVLLFSVCEWYSYQMAPHRKQMQGLTRSVFSFQPKPSEAGGFSSPFYRGRTSFGGASSLQSSGYKRQRMNSPTFGEVL